MPAKLITGFVPATGKHIPIQVDADGKLVISPTGSGLATSAKQDTQIAAEQATSVGSVAYETNRVFKATPGTLVSLNGYNSSASAQFIQIHNTTSTPVDGAIPFAFFTVPAAGNFSFSFPKPLTLSVGITICRSSTGPTKTIGGGAADVWFYGQVQ